MPRRAWGTGSLYQRKSDGRWIGSVPDGRGGRRYVTHADKRVVERRLSTLASSTTTRRGSTEPVGDFLYRWLDEHAVHRLRPRTLNAYRGIVKVHIEPEIGKVRLRDLTLRHVEQVVSKALSWRRAQTARNVLGVLRAGLSQAVRWELVSTNVAKTVSPPRVPRREMQLLDLADVQKLLDGTKGDAWHALWVLAVTTGMRSGEMRALRWRDLDLAAGTLRITGTLRRLDEWRYSRDEPKTERSRRTLTLSRAAVAALTKHKAEHARSPLWVFARDDGRPYDESAALRALRAACKRLGLPVVRVHSLRHVAAALMLEGSAGDLRMVMSTLGHSTITTTVDLYGGLAEESRKRAAAVMDSLFAATSETEG